MRVMIDTNILISAALFPDGRISAMLKEIMWRYELCVCTFSLDELALVVNRKFAGRKSDFDVFFRTLSFDLIYTPAILDKNSLPPIRDEKDYPVLLSAIDGEADVLISGDKDFHCVECERPEIISPSEFTERYL